jgi:hypothetical protein
MVRSKNAVGLLMNLNRSSAGFAHMGSDVGVRVKEADSPSRMEHLVGLGPVDGNRNQVDLWL